MSSKNSQEDFFAAYAWRFQAVLASTEWSGVTQLVQEMRKRWKAEWQFFFYGNGGNAGNAIHLGNDFLYGVAKRMGGVMKVLPLSANPAVITCLANDVGYESIFFSNLPCIERKVICSLFFLVVVIRLIYSKFWKIQDHYYQVICYSWLFRRAK
jgi:phosphoheptose isomerase